MNLFDVGGVSTGCFSWVGPVHNWLVSSDFHFYQSLHPYRALSITLSSCSWHWFACMSPQNLLWCRLYEHLWSSMYSISGPSWWMVLIQVTWMEWWGRTFSSARFWRSQISMHWAFFWTLVLETVWRDPYRCFWGHCHYFFFICGSKVLDLGPLPCQQTWPQSLTPLNKTQMFLIFLLH